jgi:hypothetical protein
MTAAPARGEQITQFGTGSEILPQRRGEGLPWPAWWAASRRQPVPATLTTTPCHNTHQGRSADWTA